MSFNTLFLTICDFKTEVIEFNPNAENLIIAFHGFGGSARTFIPLGSKLPTNYRLWTISLPWHGNTKKLDEHTSFDGYQFAADIAQLLNEKSIKNVTVLAHSFGARIASILAVNHSELIRSLIYIAPGGFYRPEDTMFRFLGSSRWKFLSNHSFIINGIVGFLIPNIIGSKKKKAVTALQNIANSFESVNVRGNGIIDKLWEPNIPFILILGSKDRLLPARYAPKITRYFKNPRTVIMHGCGHLPMIEKPEEIARILTEQS